MTYNKIDVIITLASKIVWRHDVARDMFPHISFFFVKKRKEQSSRSAHKDYSLFLSWFSLLLLLSNNKTINLQIKSNEDTYVAPPFCKGLPQNGVGASIYYSEQFVQLLPYLSSLLDIALNMQLRIRVFIETLCLFE